MSEELNMQSSDIESKPAEQKAPFLSVLILLAERRRFILRVTLGAALLGGIVAFLLPNQYVAETVVLPPGQSSSLSSLLMNQMGGGALGALATGGLGLKSPGDMYVSLFRTRTVEDAVIQHFGLMARYRTKHMVDARKQLEKHAGIILGTKDGLIRVSVRDRDAKVAAEIANGYVEEFRKLSANLAITEAAQRRQFFQQQLEEAKVNLTNAEVAMKNTEQSTGLLQIDSQAKVSIEAAATLRAQVVAKQVQLQGLRSFATEDNPEVVMAKQQLSALQSQLDRLGGTDPGSGTDPIMPKGRIPEAGMEYIRRYRDVKYYEAIYELIAKQFEAAKLDEARQGAIVQVVDVATPPDKKSFPPRILIVVLSAMAGVFVAAGAVVNRERASKWVDHYQVEALKRAFAR